MNKRPYKFKGNFCNELLGSLQDGVVYRDPDIHIQYWNSGAERITGYESREMNTCACRSRMQHLDSKGKVLCGTDECVAARAMAEGPFKGEYYILNRSGHRVAVTSSVSPVRDSRGKVTGSAEIFSDDKDQIALKQKLDALRKVALLDPVTGIGNRRHAELTLHARFRELRDLEWPFGVVLLELDEFKKVDEQVGHEDADRIMRGVAHSMVEGLRIFDTISRWNGARFLLVASNVVQSELYEIGQKMINLVGSSRMMTGRKRIRVTASGGATLAKSEDSIQGLIRRAQTLMARARRTGEHGVLKIDEEDHQAGRSSEN